MADGDLCVVGGNPAWGPAGLRAEAGTIVELGDEVEPRTGEEVIDARGAVLHPPFVNGHTHAAMTLFRGHGDDLPLMRWLKEAIWPVEAKLDEQDVYWGTRLACLEMARGGVTRFWDMYWQPEGVARAVIDAGLRATVGPPLIDGGSRSETEGSRRRLLEALGGLEGRHARVSAALAPHAIYTVGPESLAWVAETAAERGLPIEIHLSETEGEVEGCLEEHGKRPAFLLDELGVLTERTVLAHGVWLDDEELELIAERGATIVTNPVANMKLAVGGAFPYRRAVAAGERAGSAARLGLGTDGPGSNNSLDLLGDLKAFALLQRHSESDATAVPVGEAVRLATGAASPALGATPLTPGQPADFILLDADHPSLALGDLRSNLVYTATAEAVDTTVVAGRIVMRGGRVEGEAEVIARARERATRLGLR